MLLVKIDLYKILKCDYLFLSKKKNEEKLNVATGEDGILK